MTTTERSTAVGVFTERALAERAIEDLRNAGFNEDQIGFISRGDDTSVPTTPRVATPVPPLNFTAGSTIGSAGTPAGTAAPGLIAPVIADEETVPTDEPAHEPDSVAGAATGAVGGGVIGGLIGAAAALLIPGIGPAVAGGILAATLGGAAIGAVAGGFIGALTGMGVDESDARYYQDELESGRSIVTVRTTDRYDEAVSILRSAGAYDASNRYGDTTSPTASEQPAYSQQHSQYVDPTVATAPNGLDPDAFNVAPVSHVETPTSAADRTVDEVTPAHEADRTVDDVTPAAGTIDTRTSDVTPSVNQYDTTPDTSSADARTYDPSSEPHPLAHPDRRERPENNPNIPGSTGM